MGVLSLLPSAPPPLPQVTDPSPAPWSVLQACGATPSASPENVFTVLRSPFPEGQAQDEAGLVLHFHWECKSTIFTLQKGKTMS